MLGGLRVGVLRRVVTWRCETLTDLIWTSKQRRNVFGGAGRGCFQVKYWYVGGLEPVLDSKSFQSFRLSLTTEERRSST